MNTDAFAVVATFQNWRLAKTKKEHPEFDTLDLNTLTAAKYLALSTFDQDTKVDIVQDRAEQYFLDLIVYNLSDAGLAALGMAKPSLNAEVLELAQDAAIAKFFQEYAPLWLLQAIYHHDMGPYKSEIKGGSVESKMFVLNQSNIFILITMKLYHISLKQMFPAFLPYIYWSDLLLFQPKIRAYFSDAINTKSWLKVAIKCQDDDIEDPKFFDAARFNDLKTKLDLLQPNNRLSNDIVGSLWYALLSYYSTKNLVNNAVNRNLVISTNESILKRIIGNPANQFNVQITAATTALACDKATIINKISDLMATATLEIPFDQVVPTENDFQGTARTFKKEYLATTEFTSLQDNTNFIKFLNALFCACHVGVLAYGILNGHNYDKVISFDPSLLYNGDGLYIAKYVDALDQGRVFTVMGEFLRSLTNDMAKDATDVFSAYQNFVPNLIHPNTREHITRLIPAFYVLTRDQQAYKLFSDMDAVILDWGDLVINLHEMDDSEVDNCIPGLFRVLKKAGCAATSTGLLLGNSLYGLSLVARVFPQLEMTMRRYQFATIGQEETMNIPDLIEDFIQSVDKQLTIDYFNVQVDDNGWESYYESLDPRIQKGLDVLMEIENDQLNDMFVLLGEMEKRVQELEYNKFTTQVVKVDNHANSITTADWSVIPGSQSQITITRPSNIIVMLQYFSNVVNNPNGGCSVDVTSALNNQIMTNGGNNSYPWPVGTSISHSRDWTTGYSITQQVVQPGVYQYDMRARIRGGAPNALVDAPSAVLYIIPL